ncbi:hypothetical protein [Acuticoccus sp. I52.16.1]|nr:hypothetical protein [Acuticoccus sp. I52.16.1]UOM35219.1 hypothetical protein MRB58_03145 [Acuticoccus sp. I52.16.1]
MDTNLIVLLEILLIAGSLLTFAACELRDARRRPAEVGLNRRRSNAN